MVTTDETILASQGGAQPSSGVGQTSQGDPFASQAVDFDLGMGDAPVESTSSLGAFDTSSQDTVPSTASTDDFSLDFDSSIFAPSDSQDAPVLDAVEQEMVNDTDVSPLESTESLETTEPLVSDSLGSTEPSLEEKSPLNFSLDLEDVPKSEPSLDLLVSEDTPFITPSGDVSSFSPVEDSVLGGDNAFVQNSEDLFSESSSDTSPSLSDEPLLDFSSVSSPVVEPQLSSDDLLADSEVSSSEVPVPEAPLSEAPAPEYQPTADAFGQTVSALQTAKDEGNAFLSSDELPASEAVPQTSESPDTMLNLDQMVAKFNGEDIPVEENPFEPMKKALEEEEKKNLLEKGVNPDEGIPLVLFPESTSNEEEAQSPSLVEGAPVAEAPLVPPVVPSETPESLPVQQEPLPEEKDTSKAAMFSLDDIIPEGAIPVPSGQEVTTKLPGLKHKNLSALLIGGGVFAVLILVITTMFPDVISQLFGGSSTPSDVVGPVEPIEIPSDPGGKNHAVAPIEPGSEDPSGGNGDQPSVVQDPSFPSSSSEGSGDNGYGTPFIEEPELPPSTPTFVSSQEMITMLTSLSNQGKQYLDLGETENEAFLVKFGGYIWYQAALLINRLESGASLDIEEYDGMITRMNDFLTQMQAYLDGSYTPNFSSQDNQFIDEELNKQELQDFIYGQNGVI